MASLPSPLPNFDFDLPSTLGGYGGAIYDKWSITMSRRDWGIFNDRGERVLGAAVMRSINLTKSYAISNAPQEDGAFMSYDKVAQPFTATLQIVCDGREQGFTGDGIDLLEPQWVKGLSKRKVRRDFLSALEAICKDTNLYQISTPERTWHRANIIGYSISKETTQWAYMTVCNVNFQEVRSASSTGWLKSADPSGAIKKNSGAMPIHEISN